MKFKLDNIRNSIAMVERDLESTDCTKEKKSLRDYLNWLLAIEKELLEMVK